MEGTGVRTVPCDCESPDQGAPGWGGRINRSIISLSKACAASMSQRQSCSYQKARASGTKKAASFYRSLQGANVLEEIRTGTSISSGEAQVFGSFFSWSTWTKRV